MFLVAFAQAKEVVGQQWGQTWNLKMLTTRGRCDRSCILVVVFLLVKMELLATSASSFRNYENVPLVRKPLNRFVVTFNID